MTWRNKQAEGEVLRYVSLSFPRIAVKAGEMRMNHKCHLNSVHEAWRDNDLRVCMVYQVTRHNEVVVHFINQEKETGEYVDNTLGEWSRYNTYHLIRVIDEEEYGNVSTVLQEAQEWTRSRIGFVNRIFSNVQF